MKILHVKQGSPEWHAARKTTRNASEVPAMQNVSPYRSYQDLVKEKATGIVQEITLEQQRRFDKGHATEEAARLLFEDLLGESLYPMTATDDDGYLLASTDGSTLPPQGGIGFEHKLWNETLARSVAEGRVPESHAGQLDQQIAVFGFEKIFFVVSDGTRANFVYCEYRTTQERIANLMAGWKQFDADVANYQPSTDPAKPILVANSIENLPALVIEVTGRVTHSNLVEFKTHATSVIQSIKTELQTDQDFVDATEAVKYLNDVEDNAKRAKQNALAQTASIDDLFRALDDVIAMAATVRRSLSRKITEEKDKRKEEILAAAKNYLYAHIDALNERVNGLFPKTAVDFSSEIKGLKSIDSMKKKLSGALALAKVHASSTADRILANRNSLKTDGVDWSFLFPDLPLVCAKAHDDFAALLGSRIAAHKIAEEQRLESERARIRQKEAEKPSKEAAAFANEALIQANHLSAANVVPVNASRQDHAPQQPPATAQVFHAGAHVATPNRDPAAFAAEIFDDMCSMTYAELEVMGHARDRVFALRAEKTEAA